MIEWLVVFSLPYLAHVDGLIFNFFLTVSSEANNKSFI